MFLRYLSAGEGGDAKGGVGPRQIKGQGGMLVPREHCWPATMYKLQVRRQNTDLLRFFLLDHAVPVPPGKHLTEISSHLGRDSDAPERAEKGHNTFSSSQTSTTSPAMHAVYLIHHAAVAPVQGTVQSPVCHHRAGWPVHAADQCCSPGKPIHTEKPFIRLLMSRKTTPHERTIDSGVGSRAAWAVQAFGRWPVL